MPDPIDFYFDFTSPYAYFAAQKIDGVAMEFGGREVEWRPILLGAVFKETGTKPLTQQPLKGEYSIEDCARLARFMDVPWSMPDKFPIATMAAARAYYWIYDTDKALAKGFARDCFTAYFGDSRDISEADTVAQIGSNLGVDADALKAAIAEPQIKERLRTETQAAIDAGVFGSPFFIIDGEKFWEIGRAHV